jgi:hypothetical protein
MRLFLFPVVVFILFSCNNGSVKSSGNNSAPGLKTQDKVAGIDNDQHTKNAAISEYPDDSVYTANILTTGIFHEDEVSKDDAQRKWFGIFKDKDGFYISNTTIKTKKVKDVVTDEDDQKTGWQVITDIKDTSVLLISAPDYLSNRRISRAELEKNQIFPGEKISFSYEGKTYTLYATGNKQKEDADTNAYVVTDYRLFLKSTIQGKEREQLLAAHKSFDDTMITILFAGDIDGDHIPDFIINTSDHYNAEVPTLYLSKPAPRGQLLKVVGRHIGVGC